ncbi:MAG: hypothetical protein Q9219_007074 [cf. Caloplaca sp. 3 TL-2023]
MSDSVGKEKDGVKPTIHHNATMELDELAPLNDDSTLHADDASDLEEEDSEQLIRPRDKHHDTKMLNFQRPASLNRFWTITLSLVAVLIVLGLFVAWYSRTHAASDASGPTLRSNGTSLFAPTTLLISLDGFRADYVLRGLTPTLNSFVAGGISPRWMLPSFPSVTFSNHYTLATGLYPESHGIVSNTFWDPDLEEEFTYANDSISMVPKWWGGEPLWVSTERQGVRTAVHMWPGSEAGIGGIRPTFLDKFNGEEELAKKTQRILGLLDLPGGHDNVDGSAERRPQFIAAYVPVIDVDGHRYGPNSTEVNTTLQEVDAMFRDLLQGLEKRNLTDIVNVIVVSDHGMATTSTERLIQLDDLLDVNLIEHIDGWPNYGLRLKDPSKVEDVYQSLNEKASRNPNFELYLRDKNMPERYRFSQNPRIAPLWLVPKTGWAIVLRKDFDVAAAKASGEVYHPRGVHGYDHEHPLMRAIFIAKGPAFPHKANSRVEVFHTTASNLPQLDLLHSQHRFDSIQFTLPTTMTKILLLASTVLIPLALAFPRHLQPRAPQIYLPTDAPTCVASPQGIFTATLLNSLGALPSLPPVTVQPNCDRAISAICNAAHAAIPQPPSPNFPGLLDYKATGRDDDSNDDGACEAHLLFSHGPGSQDLSAFTYDSCVAGFQSITVECMLIGESESAAEGKQAGVRGVAFDFSVAVNGARRWTGAAYDGGFMVGPKGWAGNIEAVDVSDKITP